MFFEWENSNLVGFLNMGDRVTYTRLVRFRERRLRGPLLKRKKIVVRLESGTKNVPLLSDE